jgi:hypothetical protein
MITETKIHTKPLVSRLFTVVKMNLSNPWPALITPSIILSVVVISAYSLYLIFGGGLDGQIYFSPEFFFMIVLLVIANQTINQHFSLALSYGITRRDFYLGSLMGFVLLAIGYSLLSSVLGLLADPNFLIGFGEPGFSQFALVFWALLISQLIGASITTLYLRWGKVGMSIFFVTLGLIVVSTPIVLARYELSDEIERLIGADVGGLYGNLIGLGWTLLLALIGYLLIFRARPSV